MAFNEKIAKIIPRFILYPLVRYGLYAEYLAQRFFLKDTNNLHTKTNSKVRKDIRILKEDVEPSKTTQIERSLRSIVRRKFSKDKVDHINNPVDALIGGP